MLIWQELCEKNKDYDKMSYAVQSSLSVRIQTMCLLSFASVVWSPTMKHILLYQLKVMEKKHSISSVKDIWLAYGICICITSHLYKPKDSSWRWNGWESRCRHALYDFWDKQQKLQRFKWAPRLEKRKMGKIRIVSAFYVYMPHTDV